MAQPGGDEAPVLDLQPGHLGVVDGVDAQPRGGDVIGVHQRLAAAAEEGVGAVQRQRAADRRLEPGPVGMHPGGGLGRFLDGDPRQPRVGLAGNDAHQVVEIFLDLIAPGQHLGRRRMGGAQIAGVARVAAAQRLGRRLGDQHPGAALRRGDRSAERGIAPARDQDVIALARHALSLIPAEPPGACSPT
jgi:hypothetical protein